VFSLFFCPGVEAGRQKGVQRVTGEFSSVLDVLDILHCLSLHSNDITFKSSKKLLCFWCSGVQTYLIL